MRKEPEGMHRGPVSAARVLGAAPPLSAGTADKAWPPMLPEAPAIAPPGRTRADGEFRPVILQDQVAPTMRIKPARKREEAAARRRARHGKLLFIVALSGAAIAAYLFVSRVLEMRSRALARQASTSSSAQGPARAPALLSAVAATARAPETQPMAQTGPSIGAAHSLDGPANDAPPAPQAPPPAPEALGFTKRSFPPPVSTATARRFGRAKNLPTANAAAGSVATVTRSESPPVSESPRMKPVFQMREY